MATLDLASLLEGAAALSLEIQQLTAGLEDLINTHLSDAERQQLRTLLTDYNQYQAAVAAFEAGCKGLQGVGYPHLPSIAIPDTLKQKLAAERAATEAVLTLLMSPQDAVSGTLRMSEPVEKQ